MQSVANDVADTYERIAPLAFKNQVIQISGYFNDIFPTQERFCFAIGIPSDLCTSWVLAKCESATN